MARQDLHGVAESRGEGVVCDLHLRDLLAVIAGDCHEGGHGKDELLLGLLLGDAVAAQSHKRHTRHVLVHGVQHHLNTRKIP